MAQETTTTEAVKKTSDGSVKIALERYEELLAKAAEPKHVTYHTTTKTATMQAADNKLYGGLFMGGGASLFVIGAIQFYVGFRQAKALVK